MTKSIRIENADTSNHTVVVEESIEDGMFTDRLVVLDFPTAMATKTICGTRYLKVRERNFLT